MPKNLLNFRIRMEIATANLPVLLMVFNRPDLTRRVFERIRAAAPSRLFIAADGPRPHLAGEDLLCRETLAIVGTVDWPCEVHRLERDANLGCKVAVSSAIDWFFDHVEEGIILEDDCLPHPSFFPFCADLIERYREVHEVALISGNNFQKSPCKYSYYFSRHAHIWGWATWRRTWRSYDVNIEAWNGRPDSLCGWIRNARVRRYFGKQFDSIKSGKKDTWDYQLVHLCLTLRFACINPSYNLVENIGFDERATHTVSTDFHHSLPSLEAMEFPLSHPPAILVDDRADRYTETRIKGIPPNLIVSWIWSLRKRLMFMKNLFLR